MPAGGGARRLRAAMVVVALALAPGAAGGCGGGGGSAPTAADTSTAAGSGRAFVDALSSGDERAACDLVTARGEDIVVGFAKGLGGSGDSCEEAVASISDDAAQALGDASVSAEGRTDREAVVTITPPEGSGGTPVSFDVLRQGGAWRINGLDLG